MRVHNSLTELMGNTPLVRLRKVTAGVPAQVLAKVEYFNPGGSVKDRIAVRMIDAAEASGALRPGGTIVEPTSGNTGVGLAIVAQQKGYRCVFVCPDKVANDKIAVLRAYGAEVVVCPTAVAPEHPDSYYSVSDRLAAETPDGWKPDQYSNPNNPRSHYETTGPEIWEQTEGRITHFVAGIGTGGTISGTGRYLKEVSGGRVKIIGADPEGSVYSGGSGRPYLVEGVGEDIWPETYDRDDLRRDHRGERQGLLQHDPAAGPRGGAARRRLVRDGGGRGAAGRGQRPAPTTWSSSCCPTAAAATCRRSSTTSGWPTTASCTSETEEPEIDDVLSRKGTGLPEFVHVHPHESVGTAVAILREYDVSQLPVMKEEPPVMAAEVVGSVVETRSAARRWSAAARSSERPAGGAHVAAAADGRLRRAGERGRRRAGEGRRRGRPRRRQARRPASPGRTCWPSWQRPEIPEIREGPGRTAGAFRVLRGEGQPWWPASSYGSASDGPGTVRARSA